MHLNQSSITDPEYKWPAIVSHDAHSISSTMTSQYRKLILIRWLTENLLAFIFQYAGLTLTTLTAHPTPLWFASGTALAFIFMRGTAIMPGLWLGSFFAYYFIHATLNVSATSATIFVAQTYLILAFCYRWVSPALVLFILSTCSFSQVFVAC